MADPITIGIGIFVGTLFVGGHIAAGVLLAKNINKILENKSKEELKKMSQGLQKSLQTLRSTPGNEETCECIEEIMKCIHEKEKEG